MHDDNNTHINIYHELLIHIKDYVTIDISIGNK